MHVLQTYRIFESEQDYETSAALERERSVLFFFVL